MKGHASFQTHTTYFTKLVSQATARMAKFPDVDDVSESTNSNGERAGEHFDDVSAVMESELQLQFAQIIQQRLSIIFQDTQNKRTA